MSKTLLPDMDAVPKLTHSHTVVTLRRVVFTHRMSRQSHRNDTQRICLLVNNGSCRDIWRNEQSKQNKKKPWGSTLSKDKIEPLQRR